MNVSCLTNEATIGGWQMSCGCTLLVTLVTIVSWTVSSASHSSVSAHPFVTVNVRGLLAFIGCGLCTQQHCR